MHISRQDFYEMTQGEFYEALDAFRAEAEANRRHVGELARGLAVRIVNLFVKKGDQYRDVAEFWPMPWDKDGGNLAALNSMTQDERNEQARQFLESIEKHG